MTIERLWVGTVPFPDLLVRLKWQGRFRQWFQHQPDSEGPVKLPRIVEMPQEIRRRQGQEPGVSFRIGRWVGNNNGRPKGQLDGCRLARACTFLRVWAQGPRSTGGALRITPTSSMAVEWQYNFPIDRVDEEIWSHSRQTMPAIREI